MTAQTKPTLKGKFSGGLKPPATDWADLIDTIGGMTKTVAASDASDASKGRADYVCDGTQDDTEILAALAALPTPKGRVLLSEGTFKTRNTIAVAASRVTLQGMGLYGTIIQPETGYDPDPIVSFGESSIVHRCSLKDLWIYGNEDADPGHSGDGLHFYVNGGSINDVNVTWTGGDGVVVNGADATEIYETFISNLTIYYPDNDGLVVGTLCHDTVFNRVFVKGGNQEGVPFGRYGILYQGEGCIFQNCHAYFNQQHGLYADGNSDSVFISGGAYETNDGDGILLYLVTTGHIKGAWFYANGDTDIQLSFSDYIVISDNQVSSSTAANGIGLFTATYNTITHNVIRGQTACGIWIDEVSDNNIVDTNTLNPAGGANGAIGIDDSDNTWLLDNRLVSGDIDITGTSTGTVTRTPA